MSSNDPELILNPLNGLPRIVEQSVKLCSVFGAKDSPPGSFPTLPARSHWATTPLLPGPGSPSQSAATEFSFTQN